MTVDANTLQLLEWPVLFDELLSHCLTPYGRISLGRSPFLNDAGAIQQHQREADAIKTILLRFSDPQLPHHPLEDVTPGVQRLGKQGVLSLEDLKRLMAVLRSGGALVLYLKHHLEKIGDKNALNALFAETPDVTDITALLDDYVDRDGELKDSASPLLGELRQRLRQQKKSIQLAMQHLLNNPDLAGVFQDAMITEREGRFVLPVRIEQKTKVPGVVHGVSSSGSTIFVEPFAVSDLNNRLQGSLGDLDEEIARIMREISEKLAPHADTILKFTQGLGEIDRRYAAARLGILLKGNPVEVVADRQVMRLRQARHPMLMIQNYMQGSLSVIANDITLGEDGTRTMLITGPNTGGKTVLLKTAGLLALMLSAGLLLPVLENSAMSVFEPVLADIGDQQSIAQNLSTFSAHLERLKYFIDTHTDLSRGLVLIDEIASGTDPAEGAALAKAILDTLHTKGGLTLVTTHLGELKLEAHEHTGYINASMAFNAETLSPTYQLILGVPGTSNAITIAKKLGLDGAVIEKARRFLDKPERDTAALIEELELAKRQLDDDVRETKRLRSEAETAFAEVDFQRSELEREKRRMLQNFKAGLKSRTQELEDELRQIRKALEQEEIGDLSGLSDRLRQTRRKTDAALAESHPVESTPALTKSDIRIGEKLYSRRLDLTGEVIAIGSSDVTLQAGLMKVSAPLSDLEKPRNRPPSKNAPKKRQSSGIPDVPSGKRVGKSSYGNGDIRLPQRECNVIGQRVDEALGIVEKFLDDAVLANIETVGIIHGHGTGALKNAIRERLKQNPAVRTFYPSALNEGGDGRTIVELSD